MYNRCLGQQGQLYLPATSIYFPNCTLLFLAVYEVDGAKPDFKSLRGRGACMFACEEPKSLPAVGLQIYSAGASRQGILPFYPPSKWKHVFLLLLPSKQC